MLVKPCKSLQDTDWHFRKTHLYAYGTRVTSLVGLCYLKLPPLEAVFWLGVFETGPFGQEQALTEQ